MEPRSIDQIFWDAAQLASPGERDAYLDAACAGDAELRRRVEVLLAARSKVGSFLETPAAGRADDTRTAAPADDGPPDFLAPSDQPDSLGRIGHYEVQEVIGRGGMGVVLKAFDPRLHRVVAIKVMAAEVAAARRRFSREARAAAAVVHDNVVTIHAVEEDHRPPYLVMQYGDGASLQEKLDRAGPLGLREVLRIGMQAAHAQGLVHRDVKPANILLEDSVERVRITDFGLARAADDASLTQSGQVAGTPQYMSPEQARGERVDHRADLFSLGSVLYAMCAGRPPFRAGNGMAVLKRVCEDTATPIREVNPEAPEWLAGIIAKLHAKDPADRFQTAAEVAEVLGQCLAHVQHPTAVPLPVTESPAAPPRPTRRRRWVLVGLALLVAGLGAAEATGLIQIRAAVSHIFTPEGTPVVEQDHPGGVPPAASVPKAEGEVPAPVVLRWPLTGSFVVSVKVPDAREPVVRKCDVYEVFAWTSTDPDRDRSIRKAYPWGDLEVDARVGPNQHLLLRRVRIGVQRYWDQFAGYALRVTTLKRELVLDAHDAGQLSLTVAGRQVPLFLGKLIGLEQAEFTVTGAIRIDAPGVEWETSGPFVVLGGKGREERGFDTLAEAVEASESGDAIEVRGNGPFESNPIDLGRSALTIRAAEGFRPVIRFGRGSQGPRSFSRPGPLLRAGGPIVLEGLELQRRPYLNTRSVLVQCEGESVHAANCRF